MDGFYNDIADGFTKFAKEMMDNTHFSVRYDSRSGFDMTFESEIGGKEQKLETKDEDLDMKVNLDVAEDCRNQNIKLGND